jgi:hypothetical protein
MIRAGRYEIPALIRHQGLLIWTAWCLLTLFVVFGTHFGWFGQEAGHGSAWVSLLGWAGFGLLFVAGTILWWLVEAPRRVNVALWDERSIVLHPARGDAVTLPWLEITHARVRDDPGPLGRGSAMALYFSARLFAAGRDRPYKVPLSFEPDCRVFLEALEINTKVVYKRRRRQRSEAQD